MNFEQEWSAYRRLASAILRFAVSDMVVQPTVRGEYPYHEFRRLYPRCHARLLEIELGEFFQSPLATLYINVAGLRGQTGAGLWRRVRYEPQVREQIERALSGLRVAVADRKKGRESREDPQRTASADTRSGKLVQNSFKSSGVMAWK